MRHVVTVVAVLVSGCVVQTAPAPAYDVKRQAAEQPVCKDERPIGSMIVRHLCRSPEQRASDEEAKYSWAYRAPANPAVGDMTYPGIDARHTLPGPDGTYTAAPSEPTDKPSEESKTAH
jgi:hypothetical protein